MGGIRIECCDISESSEENRSTSLSVCPSVSLSVCVCIEDKALHTVDGLGNIRTRANRTAGCISVYVFVYLNSVRSFEAFALKSAFLHTVATRNVKLMIRSLSAITTSSLLLHVILCPATSSSML
jgi:hypothetical protein